MPPDLPALPRFLKSVAKLRHRQNSATTDVGARQRINWVDTASAAFTVTESDTNEEVLVSLATLGAPPTGTAGGDLTGTYPNPTLATAGGGAAGPTGSATVTPIVTVDAKGRVTALTSATTVPTNAAGGHLSGNYPNPSLATTLGVPFIGTSAPTFRAEGDTLKRTDEDRGYIYDGANPIRTQWYSAAGRTGVAVRRAATQSVPHNTLTALSWDTEDFDSDAGFTATSSTVTIKVAGLYAIYCIAYPAAGVSWIYRLAQIELSSNVFAQRDFYVAAGLGIDTAFYENIPVFPLVVNDTVVYKVQFQSVAGTAVDFTGRCYVYRIGP